jgi:dipeptidyl aminopeptidase/acylaminoacyl peptidase
MPRTVAPYGSWESPIDVEMLARTGGVYFRYQGVDLVDGGVYWVEVRPAEGGRNALVYAARGGRPVDVVPAGFNVRSRVHEYGGGAFWCDGQTIFCSSFDDGRVYRLDGIGAEPRPVTPEPGEPSALRYADGRVTPGGIVICVRESHEGDEEPRNELVAFLAEGLSSPYTIVSGNDFYAAPRPSPDGTRLAWLTWNHPYMPFESTELWVAPLEADGRIGDATLVAGGPAEAVCQPTWGPDGALYFCSDRSGWLNLYRDGEAVAAVEAEIGWPPWLFDYSSYAFVGDGRIACIVLRNGIQNLELLDPATGQLEDLGLGFTACLPYLRSAGDRIALVAASPVQAPAVVEVDVSTRELRTVAASITSFIDEESISRPEAIEFPGTDGETTHGFFYAPRNARFEAPEDELPPLLVLVHGGPTSLDPGALAPEIQFSTSRGIAMLDVNYGGSTGYGRAYRDRLKGRWGEVDVEDCIAGARFLAEQGRVDPDRMAITGGSAGGYTTLAALAWHDVFAAGVSYFGVSDLVQFHEITHKFESHYDEYLVGPWPDAIDLYRERSPINAAERIQAPLLLLQGLDDKVVPPAQSEVMVAALRENAVPHAYLAFEGEGHGFRRKETTLQARTAVLSFLAQVFGFEPAGDVEQLEIANREALTR